MQLQLPLWLSIAFVILGLVALAWSSDVFVDGASSLAKILGISPFIVGMVVIGFGTSAPELCVSVMSGVSGHSNLSLGNAYGSCIFNIAVIIGISALIMPIAVRPRVAFVAAPGLFLITVFSMWLLGDGNCSRANAAFLLAVFAVVMPLYCWFDAKSSSPEAKEGGAAKPVGGAWRSAFRALFGLVVLVGASHLLVEGAVGCAKALGVSDLVIGLTVVAAGTSLPELASAVASARRGEHEFVLGNIIGSNLFNMLAVVGLAAVISPVLPTLDASGAAVPAFSRYVLVRDLPMTAVLSLSILVFGANWRRPRAPGSIGRKAAAAWLVASLGYAVVMFLQETGRM